MNEEGRRAYDEEKVRCGRVRCAGARRPGCDETGASCELGGAAGRKLEPPSDVPAALLAYSCGARPLLPVSLPLAELGVLAR